MNVAVSFGLVDLTYLVVDISIICIGDLIYFLTLQFQLQLNFINRPAFQLRFDTRSLSFWNITAESFKLLLRSK